jgi:hypothetical protein
MEKNQKMEGFTPLELMLRWNRYCDAVGKEGDCILLNEERTYWEAFTDKDEALSEIVNSDAPDFREDEGFLITLYGQDNLYSEMRYVPFNEISNYIDLSLIDVE